MKVISYSSLLVTVLAGFVAADWQFHSRPDLSPPRLNITVPAKSNEVESGYIFIAAYGGFDPGNSGPEQPAAYIFRDNGDLIWSGLGYFAGWVANFRPDVWHGQPVLRAFQGIFSTTRGRMFGHHVILNNRYEAIKSVKAPGHRFESAHEFRIVDGKTVLIENPLVVPRDLRPWGGKADQNWIISNGFQDSALPLPSGLGSSGLNSSDPWNYFHINSVDKNSNGDYLISARNYAAIFKINGSTGNIIWQLGGKHGSTFEVPSNVAFAFQHDARFVSSSVDGTIETISFFDNAAHSTAENISPYSRARIVQLNHTSKAATLIHSFPAPDGLSAHSQGNTQILPNGNVFVNWGQAGAVTEFKGGDGTVAFHAYLDSAPVGHLVQSYRGFRFNWTGFPTEEPAIVAIQNPHQRSNTTVYVSWNGDTETKLWRFFSRPDQKTDATHGQQLGEAHRTTFETVFSFETTVLVQQNKKTQIFAEAFDAEGKFLTRTRAVSLEVAQLANLDGVLTADESRGNEGQWPLSGKQFEL